MLIWYLGIAMGLHFPYIPKKYKNPMYDGRHSDVMILDFARIANLL